MKSIGQIVWGVVAHTNRLRKIRSEPTQPTPVSFEHKESIPAYTRKYSVVTHGGINDLNFIPREVEAVVCIGAPESLGERDGASRARAQGGVGGRHGAIGEME
jgi:hypothetical protein